MVSVFQINSLSVFVFLFLRDRILVASSLDTIKAPIMFLIGKSLLAGQTSFWVAAVCLQFSYIFS